MSYFCNYFVEIESFVFENILISIIYCENYSFRYNWIVSTKCDG